MPTNVVIIGGKLQGVEALYLAKKAGCTTTLVDKNKAPLGLGICDAFLQANVYDQSMELLDLLKKADFILPTLEDDGALDILRGWKEAHHLPMGFDFDAYRISSSKIESNALMEKCGITMPIPFPVARPPYIAKPSVGSGSQGVLYLADEAAWEDFKANTPDWHNWVVQAFLPGPQYSIEIIGTPGNYRTFAVTELYMDKYYDCKRVTAPFIGDPALVKDFEDIAVRLAEAVALHGIMDVEVIENAGRLYVLEIDARMPSQTPTAVYFASGVNLLAELMATFGVFPEQRSAPEDFTPMHVAYEHLRVEDDRLLALGEHVMGQCGPLVLRPGFCGCHEALTDQDSENPCLNSPWQGTYITLAPTWEALEAKREDVRQAISQLQRRGLVYDDASPYED